MWYNLTYKYNAILTYICVLCVCVHTHIGQSWLKQNFMAYNELFVFAGRFSGCPILPGIVNVNLMLTQKASGEYGIVEHM